MSWSLQLSHGDFVLSGAQYATVTDENKMVQDLRCALGERMGTDPAHRESGSLIDGGVKPDGTTVQSPIGIGEPHHVANLVHSEIQRIAAAYQAQQLNRAKADKVIYNRPTLTAGEVLAQISDIQLAQTATTLNVTVTLRSARGSDVAIPLQLTADS